MKIFLNIDDFASYNKDKNLTFCATIGNFDGVHLGHQKIFQELSKKSKELNLQNLLITFNPHTKLFHNPQKNFLLTTLDEKIKIIEETKLIDNLLVIEFDEKFKNIESKEFIENILINKLSVHYLVIGANFNFGKNRSGNVGLLKKCFDTRIKIVEILSNKEENYSSTIIKNYILNGEIEIANNLLGYEYFIEDYVQEGNKLARQLGFPTTNIKNNEKILPKFGVYETIVTIENGKTFKSISNIGIKPTIGQTTQPVLETHLLNFNENLYNKKTKVSFIGFIREEKKFNNLDELILQIKKDISSIS